MTTPQPRTGDEVQQRSSRTPISQPENRDVARVSRSGSTTHGNAAQATSSHPQQRVTPTSSLMVPRATSTPPIPSSAQSCANSTTTSPLLLVSSDRRVDVQNDDDCVVIDNFEPGNQAGVSSEHKRKRSITIGLQHSFTKNLLSHSVSGNVLPENVEPAFNRIHAIASFFQNQHVGAVEQCADMWWSQGMQSLINTIDSTFFYPQGLPRLWLWPMLRPGPGHTTGTFPDLSHGRGVCDLAEIERLSVSFKGLVSTLLRKVTIEVCDIIRPESGRNPWLEVDAALVFVNAVRSTRTPFMLLGERSAPVTDGFVVVLTFRAGCWVSLWDEKPPEHRLDSVICNTPLLGFNRGLSFLNTPLCFVSPLPSAHSDVAVNGIVMRLRILSTPDPGAQPECISFDFKPELWLVRTAQVPPLLRCAVCLGAIRDRKFNFQGSSKHNNDTIKGGGYHCRLCNIADGQGHLSARFLLCEYCSRIAVPPMPSRSDTSMSNPHQSVTEVHIMKMRQERDLFPTAQVLQSSTLYRCPHNIDKAPNRVQHVVWTILHPQEFVKAAQFFLDFTLSATWLEDLAPPAILESQRRTPVLVWDAFFRIYVQNSHCNRAKLALFAMQFALNLTGMFKARGKAHKSEVFFEASLPFDRRTDSIITERVRMLTEMRNGIVRADVLSLMARRLVKYLDGDMWGQVLYCSCSNRVPSETTEDYYLGHKRTRCDGPLLDLALDGGIDERLSWGAFNARSTEQVRRLREYQECLRSISHNTRVQFNEAVHVHLPT